jgi:hypothetical protein
MNPKLQKYAEATRKVAISRARLDRLKKLQAYLITVRD